MIIKEVNVKNIMTKSNLPIAGYSINPYVGCTHGCKYCYACFMKRFTNHSEPWGEFLDIKNWPVITNKKIYKNQTLIIGSVTDGYMPIEEKYKRTRLFLEQMQDSGANIIITTKSDLILRDIDLIKKYSDPLIVWSINTLDEEFRARMDIAPPIERRIEAMKIFHNVGIRTCCFVSPIFPGITDVKAIIEKISSYCDYIWLENLNLRGSYKGDIINYIKEKYPNLISLYEDIYANKNNNYWSNLDKEISEYAEQNDYIYIIDEEPFLRNPTNKPIIINYFYHEKTRQSDKKK